MRGRSLMASSIFGLVLLLVAPAAGQRCDGDNNRDGMTTVDEIVASVESALNGCHDGERFVDNGDGTISDHETGKTWEKKVKLDVVGDAANPHDADNSYPWAGICTLNTEKSCQPTLAAATACAEGTEGDTTGCDQCAEGEGVCDTEALSSGTEPNSTVWTWLVALNAADFAGHDTWRLPTAAELNGIIDYSDGTPPAVNAAFHSVSCGEACADVTSAACSCTKSYFYQSSTSAPTNPARVWIVDFLGGGLQTNGKQADLHVRAVRTGL